MHINANEQYKITKSLLGKRLLQMSVCVLTGVPFPPTSVAVSLFSYPDMYLKYFAFQGFGKADHEVTVSLLKKKYTDYHVSWSDEGY